MFFSFKEGQSYYYFKLSTFRKAQNSEKRIEEKEKDFQKDMRRATKQKKRKNF